MNRPGTPAGSDEMAHQFAVAALIEALRGRYGMAYAPYGTRRQEENGTGLRIGDIPATFSVVCDGRQGAYDVQIESYPPRDYIFTDVVGLQALMTLIERYRLPRDAWPA